MLSCSLWPVRQSGSLITTHDSPPPPNIYILCNSGAELRAITNIRSLDNQSSVLSFHRALTAFTSSHRDTGIHLVWAPACRDREQDTTSRKRALLACTMAPLATLNRVQSAAYQKQAARKRAFQRWAHEWSTARSTHIQNHTPDHPCYDLAILNPHPPTAATTLCGEAPSPYYPSLWV